MALILQPWAMVKTRTMPRATQQQNSAKLVPTVPMRDASIDDIYKNFKNVNSDEIFAWISVATIYSRYGKDLSYEGTPDTAVPILFKGHNPHTGEFGDKNYRAGYPEE